jgi:hypothetical protein
MQADGNSGNEQGGDRDTNVHVVDTATSAQMLTGTLSLIIPAAGRKREQTL